ncbi:MAG TPA: peptidoglycan DD-metalloendopeptidase family protein [Candidatus Saccharimonadales bacterium]|nr:peptidoglycan DD-metalloendopeptidase family protein [Candidatus Saccharimonadales bacterium]
MMALTEPLAQLFTRSRLMILDFADIPQDAPDEENIQHFFEACAQRGQNPRLPGNRQQFNNRMLEATGARYLVSRYGEDRAAMLTGSQIAKEGRTLHMGIDIFSRGLEPVFAPCDGEIVRTGFEDEAHSYGHYLILKPAADIGAYIFMGHLSKGLPALGAVRAGQRIATLGDYHGNENGGWSRHLHLQFICELPPEGQTPIGYSSRAAFAENSHKFPNPFGFLPEWRPI